MLYVYVDQNILSDMREHKIKASKLSHLKEILLRDGFKLVYSDIHLQEIDNIQLQEHRKNHIELLKKFNAYYYYIQESKIISYPVEDIWKAFLDNIEQSKKLGFNIPQERNDQLSRKLFGVDSNYNINDIKKETLRTLDEIHQKTSKELENSVFAEAFDSVMEDYKEQAILRIENVQVDESQLGTKEIRKYLKIDYSKLKPSQIISTIKTKIEKKEGIAFPIEGDQIQKTVACYQLMNLAGYHSDDFASKKKRKDRFGASQKDMLHTAYASQCNVLLSNDNKLREKAKASYLYLKNSVKVLNAKKFVNFYK